jgi:RNA polymerase-binding transcription factor DksA
VTTGRWESIEHAWHHERYVHCDVCGRLIPSRRWAFADGDRELTACEPACEELYLDYVKPTHGAPL